jgi:phosphoribosylaminoimidazolecarboxamide formyltransferase/IMP cyclohydrolase
MNNESILVRRAFVSVSDRTDLVPFVKFLTDRGVEVYATGGTAAHLRDNGVPVRPAQELTGVVEILSGKVKSLSPRLHAAILFDRGKPEEVTHMKSENLASIDMVVVNFYPFQKVKGDEELVQALSLIDIGGPASIRAAAKNFRWVVPVPEPEAYEKVMEDVSKGPAIAGGVTPEGVTVLEGTSASGSGLRVSRRLSAELAARVFEITSSYDEMVMSYLARKSLEPSTRDEVAEPERVGAPTMPETLRIRYKKAQTLRYGENPHQRAAFYVSGEESTSGIRETAGGTVSKALGEGSGSISETPLGRQFQGKELSFNNLLDLDAAVSTCREYEEPCCVVIKHRNPSGVSISKNLLTAYKQARDCDALSAFGGVVALNRPVTVDLAKEMAGLFLEVVAAPGFDNEALEAFSKKKSLRLLQLPEALFARSRKPRLILRSGLVGLLAEEEDAQPESANDWKTVSKRAPTPEEMKGLLFLWKVTRHAISNGIVIGRGDRTLGIGAGQTSRVDAVEMALYKAKRAGHDVKGAWLASDAFFPFRDSIDLAAEAGVAAVVEPGGSVRDAECITAADEHGIVLCFTGRRCFKH